MRASWRGALGCLPAAQAGRRQRRADAPDRRTVHCLALSRLAPDNGDAARGGHVCEPEARPAADASDGIAALGPKPRTSKPAHGHKVYPCLLRNLTIERANHVWAADITSIRSGAESTGRRARCLRGGCRTRWTFRSVWRRSRSASEVRQAGDFQHRPRLAVHIGGPGVDMPALSQGRNETAIGTIELAPIDRAYATPRFQWRGCVPSSIEVFLRLTAAEPSRRSHGTSRAGAKVSSRPSDVGRRIREAYEVGVYVGEARARLELESLGLDRRFSSRRARKPSRASRKNATVGSLQLHSNPCRFISIIQ
jgi:hypothetical protein